MTWSAFVTASDPSMLRTVIEWFKNPETLLVVMGSWVLWGTMLIVLAESGVLSPILPGESLLFTAGLLHDRLGLHLPTLILLVAVVAFTGAQIGYLLGVRWGRRLFKPDARILKTAHLEKAEYYFTNYGGRSLVIGRFIPFVRTFIPIAAGMARYPCPKFLAFNALGVVVWGTGFVLAGPPLGNVSFVHDNLTLILGIIILASVLPVIIEIVGRRRAASDKEQSMLAWWILLPTLLATMVALVLPGFVWLRAGGRPSFVAIGAAPAFIFGLITILSVAYPMLDIEWEPSTALPILGMSALRGAGAWSLGFFRCSNGGFFLWGAPLREAIGARKPIGGRQAVIRAATRGAILVGFVLAALPLIVGAAPSSPVQQWNLMFHQNDVHAMLYGKNASSFGGLHELYDGRNVYYPTGWHAFVSLFARYGSVIQASNVSSLALMAVWVVDLAALVSVLTALRSAIMAAPIIGGLLLNMPANALTMYSQWPNSTGTTLVSGLAAIAIVVGRRLVADLRVDEVLHVFLCRIPQAVFLPIGVIGLVDAHPSAAFSIPTFLIALLLASIASFARRAYGRGERGQLVALAWGAIAFVIVAAPLLTLSSSETRAMGSYRRGGSNQGEAFSHAFLSYPPFSNTVGNTQWMIVQLILLIIDIAATARLHLLFRRTGPLEHAAERAGLTDGAGVEAEEGTLASAQEIEEAEEEAQPLSFQPLVSYTILAALTALAYSPDSTLRTYLLAPWYKDARRIMSIEDIALTILAAVGVAAIARLIHAVWTRSLQRILAERGVDNNIEVPRQPIQFTVDLLVLVLFDFGAIDARNAVVAQVYDPNHLGKPGMATMGELAMLRRMPYTAAPDALTLGGSITGAAYSEMIGGRKAVFPRLSIANKDVASQKILVQRFHDIGTDPEVCEVMRRLGITHFYEEEDRTYYNSTRSSRHPGLYNMDTSIGFELVDAGGTAKLWRVTAYGEVTPGGGREAFVNGVTDSRDR